jgi:hypothetical protein
MVTSKIRSGNIRGGLRQLQGYYNFEDPYSNQAATPSKSGGGSSGDADSYGEDGGDSYGYGEGVSQEGESESYGEGGTYSESYGNGADSYYSGENDKHTGGDSSASDGYSGYNGAAKGSGSAAFRPPSGFDKFMEKLDVKVPLIPSLLIAGVLIYGGMVLTAFMYQVYPESYFTNCCRLSINASKAAYLVGYNLYYCRLGEIPPIVCAMDDEDDLSDEEIERMKLRPGIGKALEKEHKKCVDRSLLEVKEPKPKRFAHIF